MVEEFIAAVQNRNINEIDTLVWTKEKNGIVSVRSSFESLEGRRTVF